MSPGHVMAAFANVCAQFDVVPAARVRYRCPLQPSSCERNSSLPLLQVPRTCSRYCAQLSVLVVILYPLHVPGTHACKMPPSVRVKWIDVPGTCLWHSLFCVYML